jgi:hypothetical protein
LARTRRDPGRVAQGFADHLNQVLNATVSRSRLAIIRDRTVEQPRFDITRVVGGEVRPLELHGTPARLLVQQKVDVDVEQGRCLTVTYSYRYQADERPESWLFRWEFLRDRPRPDYPYALAHFHVNGTLVDGRGVAGVHFPTRRLPLELVLWSLVVEWGVRPLDPGWQEILLESIRGFEERQTVA